MKKSAVLLSAACGLLFTLPLPAQTAAVPPPAAANPAPARSAADRAWLDVQAAAFTPDFSGQLPAGPVSRQAALADRAAGFVRTADRAKNFHSQYPDHAKAGEAKLVEVRALVSANQLGDASVEGRLSATVMALRTNQAVPAGIRVQAVSAYAFPRMMRAAKNHEERLAAAASVARNLAAEFPDQPQGIESLVNIAAASEEPAARQLLSEVLKMPASPALRRSAQTLLGLFDLVGKPLGAEFDGADLAARKPPAATGRPTIIYTWASWSPGSLKLAADLKKLNPAANIIGVNLDDDPKVAEALAQKEQLVGTLLYDERGREGALAQRLKIRSAPQVILADAQGIIREVRGESDLAKKLQSLGL